MVIRERSEQEVDNFSFRICENWHFPVAYDKKSNKYNMIDLERFV